MSVLILVLMEDTHREIPTNPPKPSSSSLNPCSNGRYSQSVQQYSIYAIDSVVLILVLMEDTHRVVVQEENTVLTCLNPCSNGRYSQSEKDGISYAIYSLNPCSNGRYSQRDGDFVKLHNPKVLILVLMEDTHREWKYKNHWLHNSLNPCSNGRYSQRFYSKFIKGSNTLS